MGQSLKSLFWTHEDLSLSLRTHVRSQHSGHFSSQGWWGGRERQVDIAAHWPVTPMRSPSQTKHEKSLTYDTPLIPTFVWIHAPMHTQITHTCMHTCAHIHKENKFQWLKSFSLRHFVMTKTPFYTLLKRLVLVKFKNKRMFQRHLSLNCNWQMQRALSFCWDEVQLLLKRSD